MFISELSKHRRITDTLLADETVGRVSRQALIAAQHGHGIDAGGAPRRQVSGGKGGRRAGSLKFHVREGKSQPPEGVLL